MTLSQLRRYLISYKYDITQLDDVKDNIGEFITLSHK